MVVFALLLFYGCIGTGIGYAAGILMVEEGRDGLTVASAALGVALLWPGWLYRLLKHRVQ